MTGKDYLYAALGIGVLLVVYRGSRLVTSVVGGAKKIVDGINFDPASLGPSVELSNNAAMAMDDYIRLGYMERLPDGSTRMTPEGRQYVENQKMRTSS